MRSRMVVAIASALAAFVCTTPSVAQTECPAFPITTSGAVFELSDDLVCPAGVQCRCLQIAADNVVVRLNGFSILGNGGSLLVPAGLRSTGINVLSANNVIIQGPGTISNFARGVAIIGSSNVAIYGIRADGHKRGINISQRNDSTPSRDVEINDSVIESSEAEEGSGTSGIGVLVTGDTRRTHLNNVEVRNSARQGIWFTMFSSHVESPKQNYVQNCKIKENMTGIAFTNGATDNTVRNCEIEENEQFGIQVGGGPPDKIVKDTKIRDSVIVENNFGVGIVSAGPIPPNSPPENTTIRRTCFAQNSIDIAGTAYVEQLDNALDSAAGCRD